MAEFVWYHVQGYTTAGCFFYENFDNLDDAFDTLQGSFNDTKNAMLHAYDQLQSYVNNYFDNLDVQEEINTKLAPPDGSIPATENTAGKMIKPARIATKVSKPAIENAVLFRFTSRLKYEA